MIIDERYITYMNSLEERNSEFLEALEKEALKTYVPIIRKEMQSFLKLMVMIKKPVRILEVGTAIGFSALLMSEVMPDGGHITTIEKFAKRIPLAEENFRKAGRAEQITLLKGDALEIMQKLTDTYDFIFMDAAKGQYLTFLPEVLRLLAKDGILITDNVFQDGEIIESRYAVERRNRTIHSRMREYLYTLKHHEQLKTSVLPVGDGITLSIRL